MTNGQTNTYKKYSATTPLYVDGKNSIFACTTKLFWRVGLQLVKCVSINFTRNNKISCRWQTAPRLCTPMLRFPWHKTLRSTAALWWTTAIYWLYLSTLTTLLPFDALSEGRSPQAIGFVFGMGKLEWLLASLQSVKVAWWSTQSFEHNTSTWQTNRHTRRHSKCRDK